MNWLDIPPQVREMLIEVAMQLTKRGILAGVDYLSNELKRVTGMPGQRLDRDLHLLAIRIQRARELSFVERLRKPRAELRHLLHIRNLLNLVRDEMIRYNAFFYMQPSLTSPEAIMLFQTNLAHLSRDTIKSPAIMVTRSDIPLKATSKWKIEDASPIVTNNFQGVRNPSIVIRHLPINIANHYAPFTQGLPIEAAAMVMNIYLRLNGGRDLLPEKIGLNTIPSFYKIGWNTVGEYDNYFPPETLDIFPMMPIRTRPFDMDTAMCNIERELLLAVLMHHPDWDPKTVLKTHS